MEGVVSTQYGRVAGISGEGMLSFRGIPYAKPPVEERRLLAPQQQNAWSGTLNANRFPPSAIQEASPMNPVGETSEDCLYLNLWAPALEKTNRPVMVWVHGGSFVSGSASMPQYDGGMLAKRGDLIVVGINYRLGLLGFGYFNEVLGGSVETNLGLRDILAALRWIKENIADFGGDPENITVFGESAGAISLACLLASPLAKGLFNNAIIQSGSPDYVIKKEEAERLRNVYWEKLEINKPRDLFSLNTKQILIAQRFAMRQGVQRGDYELSMPLFGMPLVPLIGDDILPEPPLAYLAENASGVNLLFGTMTQEWNYFLNVPQGLKGSAADKYKNLDIEGLKRLLDRALPGRGKEALQAYFCDSTSIDESDPEFSMKLLDLYGDFESDKAFGVPSIRMAEYITEKNTKAFHYQCSWAEGSFGAAHAVDVPLIFGGVHSGFGKIMTGGGENAEALSTSMQDAWIQFAKCGDPSTDALGNWPSYSSDSRLTMEFGEKCHIKNNVRAAEVEFWRGKI